MGYFSNGAEGADYARRYCDRCVHQDCGCAVWAAHLAHNSAGANDDDHILHMLIPLSPDGLDNEECRMFRAKRAGRARLEKTARLPGLE